MIRSLCAIAFCVVAVLSAQDLSVSRIEMAKRATKDLAQRLKVPQEQIELIKESDETWPDANLGCPGRKPLGEPTATPGFAFTLSHQGRQYVYHSDRRGHFKRCELSKPIGPISRQV
jgi:hypothetical protein